MRLPAGLGLATLMDLQVQRVMLELHAQTNGREHVQPHVSS